MFEKIKRNMVSDHVLIRVFTTYVCFLVIFISVTVVSHFVLPEGVLRNKNPLHSWDSSPDFIILALQIFFYNTLSIIAILIGNVFTTRKRKSQSFMPLGFLAFFVMISINAVTLGTWSFSVVTKAVPLADRIIRTFDLVHRAGLWEMSGQLLILCATIHISLFITDGKDTTTKNWRNIRLTKQEIIIFILGIILMMTGAAVESNSIISLG